MINNEELEILIECVILKQLKKYVSNYKIIEIEIQYDMNVIMIYMKEKNNIRNLFRKKDKDAFAFEIKELKLLLLKDKLEKLQNKIYYGKQI